MRVSRFAFVILALPVALAAQQPAAPPADPITTVLKARTAGLRRNIAQAFDSIPEPKFGYKPTPQQLTIGFIAQHVASDSYLFCNAYGDMKDSRGAEETTTPDSVKATWPRAKLIDQLKVAFDFCDKASAQLTDASLAEQTTVKFGETERKIGRANMVIGHALDLADHYSQLANYMRLNGILPPTALPRPGRGGGQ